ncbi:tyrosine-type recombinase/integrase [Thiogranum longum]|uniref:tyrosine-type recombinase/integrase n=1 Tax=Thiogranum longum TaxID=1537524 RepID=UPI001A9EEBD8|nr:site-specific integrase [Thiogranum longum]
MGKARSLATHYGLPWGDIKKKQRGVRVQIRRRGQPPLSRTFKTKGQAESWATLQEPKILSGTYRDHSVAKSMTVADLLNAYTEHEAFNKQDRSRAALLKRLMGTIGMDALHVADCMQFIRTRRGTKTERLKRYKAWLNRQVAAGYETEEDVLELFEDASKGGVEVPALVQDATIHRDLDVLGSAIKWAQSHLRLQLAEHPLPEAKKTLVVKNQRDRRPTRKELEEIRLASDSPVLNVFVELAIETCMRRGELCNLRCEDIDWENETLKITSAKSDRLKKGRHKGRTIPLTLKAAELLRKVVGDRSNGSVLATKPDSITQAFTRACQRTGVKDLVVHDLRHHGISLLFEETGLSIAEVRLMSGHASIRSLERYVNMRVESVKDKLRAAGK